MIDTLNSNKRGSFTVFSMMLLISMISACLIFIKASKDVAVKGATKALSLVWADSVLAEYDLNLYERYGIFAFYGLPKGSAEKLRYYASRSFNDKLYADLGEITCYPDGKLLFDTSNLKKQIVKAAQHEMIARLTGRGDEIEIHGERQPTESDPGKLLIDLPSGGIRTGFDAGAFLDILKGKSGVTDIIRSGTDAYFINRYISVSFRNALTKDFPETCFKQETEYLITGARTDDDIEKEIKLRIIAVREVANTAFALTDPVIRSETLVAAEVITPGPLAPVTQKALQLGWALAESYNDYALLLKGRKVPLYKDRASWALDLESVVKGGIKPSGEDEPPDMRKHVAMVDPGNAEGEKYEDYLKAMLYVTPEKIKLLRMMDLIQMDMRKAYYSDFRIKEYNTGIKAVIEVNGEEHIIERDY